MPVLSSVWCHTGCNVCLVGVRWCNGCLLVSGAVISNVVFVSDGFYGCLCGVTVCIFSCT